MTIVFKGKQFAEEKEEVLKAKIKELKTKPKLVSILVGNNKASILYTNLKQKAARKIGASFEIKKFKTDVPTKDLVEVIKKLNNDKKVHGIMVQLPLPKKIKNQSVLNAIARTKDVDGLTKNSPFVPAAVKGILEIINSITKDLPYFGKKAAVVGAYGVVGKAAVKELQKKGYKVTECDKDTRDLYAKLHEVDLVISATGVPNLIKGEMLKEGVIAIDVGAPNGDFEFKSVSTVAGFVTPVPGGVGPVTIVSLLENLVEAV